MDNPAYPPFPVSLYVNYSTFRFYYAYGNTPPDDLLENILEPSEPDVLLLGCGDIRSCFYTIWKNFKPELVTQFQGAHFVLNDRSAAILARNILFLFLSLKMPREQEQQKRWLSAIWAIWFCHELLPSHEAILQDALSNLLKWSDSPDTWSKSLKNPLRTLVKYADKNTFFEIRRTWRMWYNKEVANTSIHEVSDARRKEWIAHSQGAKAEYAESSIYAFLGILFTDRSILEEREAPMQRDFLQYLDSGSAFADSVLKIPMSCTATLPNLTLFERADGAYTLHYRSVPYHCFFHSFLFSKSVMAQNNMVDYMPNPLVDDNAFRHHPLLANSVQQFAIWLTCSAEVLIVAASEDKPHFTFTFQCSDALEFCHQLHHNPPSARVTHQALPVDTSQACFDVIHTSNLVDHIPTPDLVLSTAPFLSDHGVLLTATLTYKSVALTGNEYLRKSFGFESKLLPVICGVRCAGCDSEYSSDTSIQPVPPDIRGVAISCQQPKLLVWHRTHTLPLLPQLSGDVSLIEVLHSSVVATSTQFFCSDYGLRNYSTGTSVRLLGFFASRLDTTADVMTSVWIPLSRTLSQDVKLKPFLTQLQTQALLHDVHLHLTVSETDCPLCNDAPLTNFCSQFTVHISELSTLAGLTPSFIAFIHKEPCDNESELLAKALSGRAHVHIIDTLAGQVCDTKQELTLDFFAPQCLADETYNLTVVAYTVGQSSSGTFLNAPRKIMEGKLAHFKASMVTYSFRQVSLTPTKLSPSPTIGKTTHHIGSGDRFKSVISLSNSAVSAMESCKLSSKQCSSTEIKVCCGEYCFQIPYPFPIEYDGIKIQLSRKQHTITVTTPRKPCLLHEEKPTFFVNPENKLSFPNFQPSFKLLGTFCGMQFTVQEIEINKLGQPATTAMSLKVTFNILFHASTQFTVLSLPGDDIQCLVLIHSKLFDIQNQTPAIDLSFHFREPDGIPDEVCVTWVKHAPHEVKKITVSTAELQLLKGTFLYFASRTITSKRQTVGLMPLLVRSGVEQHFTRAVVYPLYQDSYVWVQEMGLHCINQLLSGGSSIPRGYPSPFPTIPTSPTREPSSSTQYKDDSQLNSKGDKVGNSDTKHKATLHDPTPTQSPTYPTYQRSSSIQKVGCSFCGYWSGDLKACTGCGTVQYCNQKCQRNHWKEHKHYCRLKGKKNDHTEAKCNTTHHYLNPTPSPGRQSEEKSNGTKPNRCSFCGTQSIHLKKCTGCGTVQYCNRKCQKGHWHQHKHDCELKTALSKEQNSTSKCRSMSVCPSPNQSASKHDCAPTDPAPSISTKVEKPTAGSESIYLAPLPTTQAQNIAARSEGTLSDLCPSVTTEQKLHQSPYTIKQCSGCEKYYYSLKRCPCHLVAYCSIACQRSDWPRHKSMCTRTMQ